MKKKNKKKGVNPLIIVGIAIIIIILLKNVDLGTQALISECTSNEPTNIVDFYDELDSEGFIFEDEDTFLEPQCNDPYFPDVCEGPSFIASKDSFAISVRGFPTFIDGSDIIVDDCYDFLDSMIKAYCGEGTYMSVDSCDDCDEGVSCYSSHLLGKEILRDQTHGYYYLIDEGDTGLPMICTDNNKMFIVTNNKDKYDEMFYDCEEGVCGDGFCSAGESYSDCPEDCPYYSEYTTCWKNENDICNPYEKPAGGFDVCNYADYPWYHEKEDCEDCIGICPCWEIDEGISCREKNSPGVCGREGVYSSKIECSANTFVSFGIPIKWYMVAIALVVIVLLIIFSRRKK